MLHVFIHAGTLDERNSGNQLAVLDIAYAKLSHMADYNVALSVRRASSSSIRSSLPTMAASSFATHFTPEGVLCLIRRHLRVQHFQGRSLSPAPAQRPTFVLDWKFFDQMRLFPEQLAQLLPEGRSFSLGVQLHAELLKGRL